MQFYLYKCRVGSPENICPVIVISPLQSLFYKTGIAPFPRICNSSLHLAPVGTAFKVSPFSLGKIFRFSEKRFLVIIAKRGIKPPLLDISPGLCTITPVCCFSGGVSKKLSSKNGVYSQ